MKYREKQDKGTFLTAALKSRNFQGIYFSSENLELYSCSLHSAEIPVFCGSTERALGPFDSCLQNWVFEGNAPINVNPVRGAGGECGQGEGIWCLRLSPCRAFDRAKRPQGRDIWLWPTEAWYQFRSSYQVRPSRLPESHVVGERYEVFICFNRHNPIL